MPRNRVGRSGEGCLSPLAFSVFAALSLICCLALSDCGIDASTSFFDAPSFSNNGNFFTLQNNTSNTGTNFYGYNVYYRVYSDPTAAANDLNTISITVQNTSIYTPSSAFTYLTNPTNLGGLGFLPLCILTGTGSNTKAIVPPTFFPVSNPQATISIQPVPSATSTAPNNNWYYTTTNPPSAGPTYVVRNNTVQIIGLQDSFNSTYSPLQPDYAGTTPAIANSQIYIVMFAVAYGIDPATFGTIYSFPSLGAELTYQLPNQLNGW